jgi:hypothetical protein
LQYIAADSDRFAKTATATRQCKDHMVLFAGICSGKCNIHFYGEDIAYQQYADHTSLHSNRDGILLLVL